MNNRDNYLVQREKYQSRAEKFLMMGAGSVLAIMGAAAAGPTLGALAIPALVVATASGYVSLSGFAANKVAEKMTDAYEPHTMRERIASRISSLREAAFGKAKNDNNLKM